MPLGNVLVFVCSSCCYAALIFRSDRLSQFSTSFWKRLSAIFAVTYTQFGADLREFLHRKYFGVGFWLCCTNLHHQSDLIVLIEKLFTCHANFLT